MARISTSNKFGERALNIATTKLRQGESLRGHAYISHGPNSNKIHVASAANRHHAIDKMGINREKEPTNG